MEWRTEIFDRAASQVDLLVVEIANLDDRQEAAEAFETRAYSDGLSPLSHRIEGADRAKIVGLLETADMDDTDFSRTESWAAAIILGSAVRCTDGSNGVDRALISAFDRVQATESFSSQFAMFDGLSEAAQEDLLLGIASEGGCDAKHDSVEAWLTGDNSALLQTLEAGFRGNAELRNALLVARNEWFAQRLVRYQQIAPEDTVLLAVGAGHLPGPEGVVALLEAEGYTVRRIQ